jgi:hypothetical protein
VFSVFLGTDDTCHYYLAVDTNGGRWVHKCNYTDPANPQSTTIPMPEWDQHTVNGVLLRDLAAYADKRIS